MMENRPYEVRRRMITVDEHKEINWNEVIEWDKEYHLKIFKTEDEYQCVPIEHTEGDYFVTPDGTKLLDYLWHTPIKDTTLQVRITRIPASGAGGR